MAQPIHIALTFDEKYWAPAYAVMRSVCLTTLRRKDVTFHLFHPPLQPAQLRQLQEIETEFGAALSHSDPSESPAFRELTASLLANARFPAIVYTRILLDKLLPAGIERIVYLDCDTLVRRPIEELYNADLEGRPIAAVPDIYHDSMKLGRDMQPNGKLFDAADPYFNSGVLLIDLLAFAAADLPGRIRDMEAEGLLARIYYDQDLLNYIFLGNWTELNWRFNAQIPTRALEPMGMNILHYTANKPWLKPRAAAFGRAYRHVMTNRVFYWFRRERLARKLPPLLRGLIRTAPAQ